MKTNSILKKFFAVRKYVLFLLLLPTGAGCGSYLNSRLLLPQKLDDGSVLVLPLANFSPFPEAGVIVADLVATELKGFAGLRVREKPWLLSRASDLAMTVPDVLGRATAAELARLAGADLLIAGVVYEFGYQREYQAVSEHALVAIRLELVRSSDHRLLWTGSTVVGKGGDLMPGRPPLNAVAQNAVAGLMADLMQQVALAQEADQ